MTKSHDSMYKGIIYKYTSPSSKIYIGQSINEKSRRNDFFNENKEYAGPEINNARDKYGTNNFEYEIIFRVESFIESEVKDLLNEKEVQYIKLFDSFENGYNANTGGGSATYIRTEETKIKNSEALKDYYKDHTSHVAKSVLQFNMNGGFLKEWESARMAAKSINKEGNTITNVCNGKRNHAHGFVWRYRNDFGEIPIEINIPKKKGSALPVSQYTLDNEFVQQWDNLTIAANELGYSLGNFSTYCNGRKNHCYKGFKYYRGGIK